MLICNMHIEFMDNALKYNNIRPIMRYIQILKMVPKGMDFDGLLGGERVSL